MTNEQKRVENCMRTFDQEVLDKPTQDESEAKAFLRARLMLEETLETITKGLGIKIHFLDTSVDKESLKYFVDHAMFQKTSNIDLVELADGIADMNVVSLGTSSAYGIDQEDVNIEVYDSNDSKVLMLKDVELAKKLHPDATISPIDDKLFKIIRADGKYMKSPTFFEPKIKEILEFQGWDGK